MLLENETLFQEKYHQQRQSLPNFLISNEHNQLHKNY